MKLQKWISEKLDQVEIKTDGLDLYLIDFLKLIGFSFTIAPSDHTQYQLPTVWWKRAQMFKNSILFANLPYKSTKREINSNLISCQLFFSQTL